jgi:tetratricopeptide (TPR) repeat protein
LITEPAERVQLLEQSYTYYGQSTSLSPNNAQLWNEWGLVAYFLGRYEDAVDKYQHSLQLDPRFVDTYVFLGDAYQALNKPEEALEAHLKAVEMNPGSLSDQRLFSLPIPGFQERRLDFYVQVENIDIAISGPRLRDQQRSWQYLPAPREIR